MKEASKEGFDQFCFTGPPWSPHCGRKNKQRGKVMQIGTVRKVPHSTAACGRSRIQIPFKTVILSTTVVSTAAAHHPICSFRVFFCNKKHRGTPGLFFCTWYLVPPAHPPIPKKAPPIPPTHPKKIPPPPPQPQKIPPLPPPNPKKSPQKKSCQVQHPGVF